MARSLPRGITRVEHAPSRTVGWRVYRQRGGTRIVQLFSDGVWGGQEKALDAALRFHRQLRATLPPLSLAEHCQARKRSNRTGVVGVCRVVQARDSGGKAIYWVASCPTGRGRQRHRKFAVSKFGERQARAQAIAARHRALKALARLPVWRLG